MAEPIGPVPDSAVTICLVEDNAVLRELLVQALTAAGIRVLAAVGSLHEGQYAVALHLPDVAVIDNNLPDGCGTDLCRVLSRTTPSVALVVHTAAASDETRRAAFQAGAHQFLAKSTRMQPLVEAIRAHAA